MRLTEMPIEFELDRIRWDHGELFGNLTIRAELFGARTLNGILSSGTFNCSAKEFCIRALQEQAKGEPARDLRTFERRTDDDKIEIHGLPILDRHPIILFGDGGVAKIYLALYFAGELARRGLRVLYADWELTGEDHRDRLERLFGPEMPEVWSPGARDH